MTNIGLLLIVLGWAYQAWKIFKGNKIIQPIFIGAYSVGVLFLIVGGSGAGAINFISLDGLSFLLAIIILIILWKKK